MDNEMCGYGRLRSDVVACGGKLWNMMEDGGIWWDMLTCSIASNCQIVQTVELANCQTSPNIHV